MSTHPQPTFVDSEVLKALLEDPSRVPGRDYLVIDVRDEDRIGGHIPGSVNIPSKQLPERLPDLVEEYKQVPQLFFHCALSQVRGPKAAHRWSQALAARDEVAGQKDAAATEAAAVEAANRSTPSQKVYILRGGFGEWQRKHKDNANLVEAYQEEYWSEDYYN